AERVQTRQIVSRRDAGPDRWSVRRSGDPHEARFSLDDRVVSGLVTPWTGLPVAGNRAVDQTGIELVDRLVAEPQFVEAARFEVLDENIRLSEQRPKVVRTLLAFQIEADAPLAPIDASKVRAPRTHERRPRPGIVAFGR